MFVALQIDRSSPRQWHLRLIDKLAAMPGVDVSVVWAEPQEKLPSCVAVLFALERLVNRLPDNGLAAPADPAAFASHTRDNAPAPDIQLDLCGTATPGELPAWCLSTEVSVGEIGIVSALLAGHPPIIALVDTRTGQTIVSGRPGTETPGVIISAFEDCLARTITLITAAIEGGSTQITHETATTVPIRCATIAKRALKVLIGLAVRRLYNLCCYAPHWRIGWRFVEDADVFDLMKLPSQPWNVLPDDGFHFYADPFPIVVNGRSHMFVEDFDHRIGRGIISVVDFDDLGPCGSPRPVLSKPNHLSYPFVFAHADELWMVPESVGDRSVDLYRAAKFPDVWVHEATLVSDVEASDPTLYHDGKTWWMMASVRDGGSFSDALYLWSASSLLGPWQAHPGNPVLIDSAAARPAGRCMLKNGRLIRPVQDCRRGYGAALGLAEITRLDALRFEQKVLATIESGPMWPGRRLHTLNRSGRLECIDGSAVSFKLRAKSRSAISDLPQIGTPDNVAVPS